LTPSGGNGWIVAGTRMSADGGTTATVWTSKSGTTWTAQTLTGPEVDSAVTAATTWHNGTVVVGSVGSGTDETAAVWVSTAPGAPLVQVPAEDLTGGAATMTTVAGSGLGLFAAGQVGSQIALWYSNNGRDWSRLKGAENVINGATDPHVDALLATAGSVYAAGWEQDGDHTDAAMWSSSDGITWRPVLSAQSAFAGGGDRVITALAAEGTQVVPTGYVAVGAVRTGSAWKPASWISPNGASWSQPSNNFATATRPQGDNATTPGPSTGAAGTMVRDLALIPTGPNTDVMFAAGGSGSAQRLWRSTDGIHWTAIGLPAAAADSSGWRATLLASNGSTTMVVDGENGAPHVLVDRSSGWSEPSANPAVFGAVRSEAVPVGLSWSTAGLVLAVDLDQPGQTIGPQTQTTVLLTSSDGSTWNVAGTAPSGPGATSGPFSGAEIDGVSQVGDRYVAVGTEDVSGRQRAVAWTSTGARTWSGPVALGDSGTSDDTASGLCLSGGTLLAVGQADVEVSNVAATHPVATTTVPGGSTSTSTTTRPAQVPVSAGRSWSSSDGVHWRAAAVSPAPHAGIDAAMTGCAATGTSVVVYGTETTGSDPFLIGAGAWWTGSSGSTATVTHQGDDPFGSSLPSPLIDLSVSGSAPAAAGGSGASGGPGASDGSGGSTTSSTSVGNGGTASTTTGSSVVAGAPQRWLAIGGAQPYPDDVPPVLAESNDGGGSWQVLSSDNPPWAGVEPARLDQATWMGTVPVVTGSVDGQLAVWIGAPNS
jgi:hypothetical protein